MVDDIMGFLLFYIYFFIFMGICFALSLPAILLVDSSDIVCISHAVMRVKYR